jgi:hypothetical protein
MATYSARDVQVLHIHQLLSDILVGNVRMIFQAVRENVRCRSPLFSDVALPTRLLAADVSGHRCGLPLKGIGVNYCAFLQVNSQCSLATVMQSRSQTMNTVGDAASSAGTYSTQVYRK